jgi:hypothetical protein
LATRRRRGDFLETFKHLPPAQMIASLYLDERGSRHGGCHRLAVVRSCAANSAARLSKQGATELADSDNKLLRTWIRSGALFWFCCAALMSGLPSTASAEAPAVVAIDVLLEPDATMVQAAKAANAQLRENYDKGYALDATHAPHVTLLQRFVAAKDFDAVTAAVTQVLASERPLAFAASPESPDINSETVRYVETFVPDATGAKNFPHVTIGVAEEDFVKKLMAEPFKPFSFSPARVAIYQLGNFGTAQRKLWTWNGS